MFRPGNLGHIGRLGLVAASRPGLVAQALAILAKYGSAANLYLPGVGAINGITAGNWLDTTGTTAASVDGQVGRVDNARGGVNLTQSTAANRPILRLSGGVYAWQFDGSNDSFTSTLTTGNEGWICCSVKFMGVANAIETVFSSGAMDPTQKGVRLTRVGTTTEDTFWCAVANGAARHIGITNTMPLRNRTRVIEGGWNADSVFSAVDGVSGGTTARNGSATPQHYPNPTIGAGADMSLYMNGTIGATIIMPTVLPTDSERATLRQFISSLSGVTM